MDLKENSITCLRCHVVFTCKSNDITNCQCRGVELSVEARDYISSIEQSCLCIKCLTEIKNQFDTSTSLGTMMR